MHNFKLRIILFFLSDVRLVHIVAVFEPKLTQVAKDNQLTVHFLNSENQDSDTQELRTTYDVPTVPGLLVAKSGHVKVVCDSSLSEEAILDFITH